METKTEIWYKDLCRESAEIYVHEYILVGENKIPMTPEPKIYYLNNTNTEREKLKELTKGNKSVHDDVMLIWNKVKPTDVITDELVYELVEEA